MIDAERIAAEKAADAVAAAAAAAAAEAAVLAASRAPVAAPAVSSVNEARAAAAASKAAAASGRPLTDTEELIAANRQRREDQKIETRALQAKRLTSKVIKGSFSHSFCITMTMSACALSFIIVSVSDFS